jgi:hypothetical protein
MYRQERNLANNYRVRFVGGYLTEMLILIALCVETQADSELQYDGRESQTEENITNQDQYFRSHSIAKFLPRH